MLPNNGDAPHWIISNDFIITYLIYAYLQYTSSKTHKFLTLLLVKYIHQAKSPVMLLNKIVNINVQGENRVLFSEQNYFLYRAYTTSKYSPVLIK